MLESTSWSWIEPMLEYVMNQQEMDFALAIGICSWETENLDKKFFLSFPGKNSGNGKKVDFETKVSFPNFREVLKKSLHLRLNLRLKNKF